ncbi:MAG TPA: alpha/beta fold hydrolase [Blastococcus sp.]|nr:alpha/beta fold hydrolase [Blastococcus sp.]
MPSSKLNRNISSAGTSSRRCPLDRWPDVPSTYVLMTEDRAVGTDWSRRVAATRLGGDLRELPGSHSPFYSRPAELAELLMSL